MKKLTFILSITVMILVNGYFMLFIRKVYPVSAQVGCPFPLLSTPILNGVPFGSVPIVVEEGGNITISIPPGSGVAGTTYYIYIGLRYREGTGELLKDQGPISFTLDAEGKATVTFPLAITVNGSYQLNIYNQENPGDPSYVCSAPATIEVQGGEEPPPPPPEGCFYLEGNCIPGVTEPPICDIDSNWCQPVSDAPGGGVVIKRNCQIEGGGCCRSIENDVLKWDCNREIGLIPSDQSDQCYCMKRAPYLCDSKIYNEVGVKTAIGCIPFQNTNNLIAALLRWGVGILGGIAFLMLLIGSFLVMSSQGDSKKLTGGKQLITATVSAVLFLIFSIFIIRLISSSILGLG